MVGEGLRAFDALIGTGTLAALAALAIVWIIIVIGLYIYTSWAFMSIGRRAKTKYPQLAWIPAIGPLIVASQAAKMHWWPILLLVGVWIPVLGAILSIIVAVFFIIWLWKTFEVVNRPGWWAILCLIPLVNLVLIGIAAWGS